MNTRTRRSTWAVTALVATTVLATQWTMSVALAGSTNWTIAPGAESITVSWGGFATGDLLSVNVTGNGIKSGCSSVTGSCSVSGLVDGTSYSVSAQVVDAAGPLSSTSGIATPFTTPGAPTVSATATNRAVVVAWSAPSFDGGSTVLKYTARAVGPHGTTTCTSSGGGCTIGGLENGTRYLVAASATNAAGEGPWSANVEASPAGVPGTVRNVSVRRDGADRLIVSWRPPTTSGGRPVTRYEVRDSLTHGASWTSVTALSGRELAGVDEARNHLFEVAAINAVGFGPWSSPVPSPEMVVSNARSTVFVVHSDVVVGEAAEVVVQLRDSSGVPVGDRNVTLSAGVGGVLFARTGSSGRASFTFERTRATTVNYFVRDASSGVIEGVASVNWRAGRVHSATVHVQDVAGGARMIVVTVHDQFGNAVREIQVQITGASQRVVATSDASGVARLVVRGHGTLTFRAVAEGVAVGQIGVTFPSSGPGRAAVHITFDGGIGLKLGRYLVTVKGLGLGSWAGELAVIVVHSREFVLGQVVVGPNGTFATSVHLPSTLSSGHHLLIVRVGGAGEVGSLSFDVLDGVVTAVGTISGPSSQYPPFVPKRHGHELLAITAGLMVALAAIGARGRSRVKSDAGLVDVELERVRGEEITAQHESGARRWLDEWSRRAPPKWARLSPVLARVASDGDYLRASLGVSWVAGCAGSVGLGVALAHSSNWLATVPTWPWLAALVAVGVVDAGWGLLAGFAWVTSLVVSGHLTTSNEVRGLMGVVLLGFAVSLAAGSIAPMRRRLGVGREGVWIRASDVVVASAFGAFVALEMSRALAPLFGVEFSGALHPGLIALVAAGTVAARMGVETVVVHRAVHRLAQVQHDGELVAGSTQIAVSLLIQIATFVFVSVNVVTGWPLVAGTVVFFAPLVAGLRPWRVVRWIRDHMIEGALRWSVIIAAGGALAWLIEHLGVHGSSRLEVGFVLMAIPVVTLWTLELFEGEMATSAAVELATIRARLLRRGVGVVMVAGIVWLVVSEGIGT